MKYAVLASLAAVLCASRAARAQSSATETPAQPAGAATVVARGAPNQVQRLVVTPVGDRQGRQRCTAPCALLVAPGAYDVRLVAVDGDGVATRLRDRLTLEPGLTEMRAERWSRRRTAGVVIASVGGLALVGGTVLSVLAPTSGVCVLSCGEPSQAMALGGVIALALGVGMSLTGLALVVPADTHLVVRRAALDARPRLGIDVTGERRGASLSWRF